MNSAYNAKVTIEQLPHEVLFMILDLLTFSERLSCRLLNRHFKKVASYIFKVVHFSSRARVKFFSEALQKSPCIAPHVQVIKVDNAALLRAINQTNIKEVCYNVKEVDILHTQGRGTWAQHLAPYLHLQHPPTLMDETNAKIVLDKYEQQIMTLRLGGKYLENLSTVDISNLIKRVPNTRTFGLHYLYKEKNRMIHSDLPHSYTFEELNTIMKEVTMMTRFELYYCEVADLSLIGRSFLYNSTIVNHIRGLETGPFTASLFNPLQNLKHITIKEIKVTNVTWFIQSILKSFSNLESMDITFVPRDFTLENTVGKFWDKVHPEAWEAFDLPPSKLKKVALAHTESRLDIPMTLMVLGKADASLQEISIIGSGNPEWDTLTVISDFYADSIQHLKLEAKKEFGVERIRQLSNLTSASLKWIYDFSDLPFCPITIIKNSPKMKELQIGSTINYARIISIRPNIKSFDNFQNITSLTLDRVVLNQVELKRLFLPLLNIKEAVFRYCLFDLTKDPDEEEINNDEIFCRQPSTGERMDSVRRSFFIDVQKEEVRLQYENIRKGLEIEKRRENMTVNGSANEPLPKWTPKRKNLHIRSLSLQHLGLHDCRLKEPGSGTSTSKTIRNFEVVQDKRSGCFSTYNIDRAYHEKKNCNPYVVVNHRSVGEHTIGFHLTHEFGGTTGKNDYQNTRPTFVINVFSLEKLSIRPNCLMSIYFTAEHGERLKDCKTVVDEECAKPIAAIQQQSLADLRDEMEKLIEDFGTEEDNDSEDKGFISIKNRTNREIEQVSDILSKAVHREAIAIDDDRDDVNNKFTLDKKVFDLDIFKGKTHSSRRFKTSTDREAESSAVGARRKNKKTLAIRPF